MPIATYFIEQNIVSQISLCYKIETINMRFLALLISVLHPLLESTPAKMTKAREYNPRANLKRQVLGRAMYEVG